MKKILYICLAILFVAETSLCYTIKDDESVRAAIFGGQRANINEAPYHVALLVNGQYICGGSLITLQHVLTAGHCLSEVQNNPYMTLQVIAGTDSQYRAYARRNAERVFVHPRFGGYEDSYDVGIILLSQPFEKSDVISAVPLPHNPTYSGERVTITGFGRYSSLRYETSPILKKFQSVVIDCNQGMRYPIFKDGDLCVRSAYGHGICSGDSGSPLVNQNGEVVGVASRVFGCGDGTPNIYSNVYYYLQYIKTIVEQTSGYRYAPKFRPSKSVEDPGPKGIPDLLDEILKKNDKYWWPHINANSIQLEKNMDNSMKEEKNEISSSDENINK